MGGGLLAGMGRVACFAAVTSMKRIILVSCIFPSVCGSANLAEDLFTASRSVGWNVADDRSNLTGLLLSVNDKDFPMLQERFAASTSSAGTSSPAFGRWWSEASGPKLEGDNLLPTLDAMMRDSVGTVDTKPLPSESVTTAQRL